MGHATCNTQRLMAPAGVARATAFGASSFTGWSVASSFLVMKPFANHPVIENFGDLTTQWPEEAPL